MWLQAIKDFGSMIFARAELQTFQGLPGWFECRFVLDVGAGVEESLA
jgi:hypothetical protein